MKKFLNFKPIKLNKSKKVNSFSHKSMNNNQSYSIGNEKLKYREKAKANFNIPYISNFKTRMPSIKDISKSQIDNIKFKFKAKNSDFDISRKIYPIKKFELKNIIHTQIKKNLKTSFKITKSPKPLKKHTNEHKIQSIKKLDILRNNITKEASLNEGNLEKIIQHKQNISNMRIKYSKTTIPNSYYKPEISQQNQEEISPWIDSEEKSSINLE